MSVASPGSSLPSTPTVVTGEATYAEFVKSWDDERVAQWLADVATVGQQYVGVFKANDINGNVLLDVDQQALKEMGIRSVGDRVKITVAIKSLRAKCAQSARAAMAASPKSAPGSTLPPTVKRAPGTKPTGRVPPPLLLPRSNSGELPQAWQPGPRMPATGGPRPRHLSPNGTPLSNPSSPLLAASSSSTTTTTTSPRMIVPPSMPPPRSQPPLAPSPSPTKANSIAPPSISTTAASPTASLGAWRAAPVVASGASVTRSASTSARSSSRSAPPSATIQHRKTSSSSASVARPPFSSAYNPNQPLSAHPYATAASSSSSSSNNNNSLMPSPLPPRSASVATNGNLDSIMKFVSADDGATRTIAVDDCRSGRDVLIRVLRKFGKLNNYDSSNGSSSSRDDELDNWVVCLSESDNQMRILSEEELESVCRGASAAERQRGLILRRVSPSPEATLSSSRAQTIQGMFDANDEPGSPVNRLVPSTRIEPASPMQDDAASILTVDTESPPRSISSTTKRKNRASTVSILSSLGGDAASSSTSSPSPAPSGSMIDPRNRDSTMSSSSSSAMTGRKLRNFFGQRPPSELIATHLTEYFPRAEKSKLLSKQVRQSMRRSIIRRNSYAPSIASSAETYQHRSTSDPTAPADESRPNSLFERSSVSLLEPHDEEGEEDGVNTGTLRPSNARRLSSRSNSSRISGLSAWERARASAKDSDAASMITVDEVTAELETRRYSSGDDPTTATLSISSEDDDDDDSFSDSDDFESDGTEADETFVDGVASSAAMSTSSSSSKEPAAAAADKPKLKWVKGALIGSGSFGSVFLGMNPLTGSLMAVKQVELPTGHSHNEERKKSMVVALEREIELLKTLQHDNIVQYLDSSTDATHLNIFLEYVPGGSVAALLSNYGAFEEALVAKFVKQILTGLSYLHEREIVHRDIKGANILVDNKGGIKISDFGISKRVEDNLLAGSQQHRPSLQGSVYWMAPEVVKQTSYSSKADIWSLGCLVVEMLTGEHPWANLTQMQAIFRIGSSSTPAIPDDISSDAEDFLRKTFCIDHNARPSARELLNHPFITADPSIGAATSNTNAMTTPTTTTMMMTTTTMTNNNNDQLQQTPTRATFSSSSSSSAS